MNAVYLDTFNNLFQIPGKIYSLLPGGVQIFILGCFGILILVAVFKMLF